MNPAYLVGLGGALGAMARYLVAGRVPEGRLPYGNLTVNVVGSFVLGTLTFVGVGDDVMLLVGTGACGAFTTFSSFSVETSLLWERGEHGLTALNAAGNLAACLLAVGTGWLVAALL
ncbi:fluoride efflux transporter CrcB [Haladaptatus sp. GCM10025707]|uniref:fluoride efflux transporter CrcB n=2 Tax=unclassified Haladaptatus TaxID=2622732 RepID=UPI00360708E6